jgi:putative FmdB family regulatory protein
MPIYAYKCESCGFAKDVLQKMSDAQLTDCPSCGASAFKKQLTAAGFQLKGSGWYATDFKGGPAANATPASEGSGSVKAESGTAATGTGPADPKSGSAGKSQDGAAAAPKAVSAPTAPSAGSSSTGQ